MGAYREDQLTSREMRYLDNIRMGMDHRPAILAAGWAEPTETLERLKKREIVQKELAKIYRSARRKANITRDEVLCGFKEAIDDAKLAGDPGTQIKGWTEIGKMCGFYAPEERKVTVELSNSDLAKQIDSMSVEELLEIAGQDSLEIIEGHFEVIEDDDNEET